MAQTGAESPSAEDNKGAVGPAAVEDQPGPSDAGFATSADSLQNEAQDGVRAIEAVAMTWSKWGLIVAYIGIFLMAFATSLEGQVSYSMSVFATSSFNSHALVSTVLVVQSVVMAVIKPIMAKVGDVFGRLEAFSISVLLYVLGYVQQAASRNVDSFASAQIFYSAGFTGTQILQQIFIADTSDLLWRALFSSLPDVPFLVTVWVGPEIVNALLKTASWRWGYAIWAIVLPVAFAPFAVSLFLNQRRARRLGLMDQEKRKREGGVGNVGAAALSLVQELDVVGILLLSAAFALILIPLTIASKQEGGYSNPSIVAMLVVGVVCFVAFPFWEASSRVCPHPLIPLSLLRSKTFCAGCGIGFFYFMVFYMSHQPYFYSYLLVVQGIDIPAAGRISQTFSFTSTVTSILVSVAIRYTRHYKYFVTTGALIYLTGIGLMIRYRSMDTTVSPLVGTQICVGVGGGMLNVPAQLGVQAA
ncbi:siderophore iron transporter mirC, partial [Magnaporthiopsis poae ATCC 64411]